MKNIWLVVLLIVFGLGCVQITGPAVDLRGLGIDRKANMTPEERVEYEKRKRQEAEWKRQDKLRKEQEKKEKEERERQEKLRKEQEKKRRGDD